MAHRAKHRRAALLRRVDAGRWIKSDLDADGVLNLEYLAARARFMRLPTAGLP
jgi:hypothetical protein